MTANRKKKKAKIAALAKEIGDFIEITMPTMVQKESLAIKFKTTEAEVQQALDLLNKTGVVSLPAHPMGCSCCCDWRRDTYWVRKKYKASSRRTE